MQKTTHIYILFLLIFLSGCSNPNINDIQLYLEKEFSYCKNLKVSNLKHINGANIDTNRRIELVSIDFHFTPLQRGTKKNEDRKYEIKKASEDLNYGYKLKSIATNNRRGIDNAVFNIKMSQDRINFYQNLPITHFSSACFNIEESPIYQDLKTEIIKADEKQPYKYEILLLGGKVTMHINAEYLKTDNGWVLQHVIKSNN